MVSVYFVLGCCTIGSELVVVMVWVLGLWVLVLSGFGWDLVGFCLLLVGLRSLGYGGVVSCLLLLRGFVVFDVGVLIVFGFVCWF